MIFFKSQKGFSLLVNLLASMSIISLMLILSIPYLRRYQPNMELSSVARELTANLRLAQQLTITEQTIHLIEMDFTNDKYSLVRGGTSTTTLSTIEFPVSVQYYQITGLTDNKVSFNSYGAVNESGQISLNNTNNKYSVITVKPSGYIQLNQ